jgi:hypothetical protein
MEYRNYFKEVATENFSRHLTPLKNQQLNCLQVGVFRGDATEYLLSNVLIHPGSTLYDVDIWGGTTDVSHVGYNFTEIENYYDEKFQSHIDSGRIIKCKLSAWDFFKMNELNFDFIYIDGNHSMENVLRDGIQAFQVLNKGGILAFDDYKGALDQDVSLRPGPAIDALVMAWGGQIEIIEENYQLWILKK